MFPLAEKLSRINAGLPHRRGGVSDAREQLTAAEGSSPQAWGCFLHVDVITFRLFVFPTGVGVFLKVWPRTGKEVSLPHRRGGVSQGQNRQLCDL